MFDQAGGRRGRRGLHHQLLGLRHVGLQLQQLAGTDLFAVGRRRPVLVEVVGVEDDLMLAIPRRVRGKAHGVRGAVCVIDARQ